MATTKAKVKTMGGPHEIHSMAEWMSNEDYTYDLHCENGQDSLVIGILNGTLTFRSDGSWSLEEI